MDGAAASMRSRPAAQGPSCKVGVELPVLRFHVPGGTDACPKVERVLLGGYTGRQQVDVAAHVAEMKELGVPVPPSFPVFYNAMPCLLTQGRTVEIVGPDTRPEVEFVLFGCEGKLFVTVGNDQFDLAVERRLSPEKSKNLCQKVVAATAWPLDGVRGHWDHLHLELRGRGEILQAAPVSSILEPAVLLESARRDCRFDETTGMLFSGTVPSIGTVDAGMSEFSISLRDRVLEREIRCDFRLVDITSSGETKSRPSMFE